MLIREHLQLDAEGSKWLLRYGNPEDGLSRQYSFGIEAIVRMMLLDEKLVGRLRSEVECSTTAFSPAAVHCIMVYNDV